MLVLAAVLTVMAVAWTGWTALRDLEGMEHQLDLEAEPVVRQPRLRLIETGTLARP